MFRATLASFFLLVGTLGPVAAEGLSVGTGLSFWAPVADSEGLFQPGYSLDVAGEWRFDPAWAVELPVAVALTPTQGEAKLLWADGAAEVGYDLALAPDWRVRATAGVGYFAAALTNLSVYGYGMVGRGGLEALWNVGPGVEFRVSAEYVQRADLYRGIELGFLWWVGGSP